MLAFVEARIGDRTASEDVVQETLLGFLTSLPNYDQSRSLEGYLFSIAAHKLTDHLRPRGAAAHSAAGHGSYVERLVATAGSAALGRALCSAVENWPRSGGTIAGSGRTGRDQIDRLRERGDWNKLACLELVFVRGWGNKEAAGQLDLSEQSVANFKFEFLERLRTLVRKQQPSADVFPELYEPS